MDNYAASFCSAIESGHIALQGRIEKMCEEAQAKIDNLKVEREQYEVELDEDMITMQLSNLKRAIEEFKNFKTLSRERILRNIKEILVDANGGITVVLTPGTTVMGVVKMGRLNDLYPLLAACLYPQLHEPLRQ